MSGLTFGIGFATFNAALACRWTGIAAATRRSLRIPC